MATAQVRSDVLAPAVLRTASAAGFAPHCTQTNIAEFYQLTFKEECEKSLPFLSLAAVSREPFKTAAKEKNKSANVRSGLGLTNVGPRARRQGTILVPPPWRGNVARSGPPKIAPLTPAPRGPVACIAKAKTARGKTQTFFPKEYLMDYKHAFETLADLRSRVSDIEQAISELSQGVPGPVARALERTRDGTSLLRGLLWSADMAVEAERDRAQGRKP